MKKSIIFATILILAASCASRKKDKTAIEVGDIEIPASQFSIVWESSLSSYDTELVRISENKSLLKEHVIDDLVAEAILVDEALRRSFAVSKKDLDEELNLLGLERPAGSYDYYSRKAQFGPWEERAKRILLRKKMEARLLEEKVAVSEAEISDYYLKHAEEFMRPFGCRFREVRSSDRKDAEEALRKLSKGESFEDVAAQYPEGPYSDRGGDTGFMDSSLLPPFLADACSSMKIGDVSGVIQSPYGFFVITLLDRKEAKRLSLEESRDSIKDRVRREKGKAVLEEWLADMKKKYPVAVNGEVVNEIIR